MAKVTRVTADRWEPDDHMIEAVLATPKSSWRMVDLSKPDRSWLVAGLTIAGVTAQDIADKLSCSLRLVRTIRAEEMTQVCYLLQLQVAGMNAEVRRAYLAQRAALQDATQARAETAKLRAQFDQVLDAHIAGTLKTFPRCGHPKVPYNVYKSQGREYCRHCRTVWDQNNREKPA